MPDSDSAPRPWYRRWQWEMLLLLYAAYDGSRWLVGGEESRAEHHGETLLRAERRLRVDPEHWLNHAFAGHASLGIPADYLYATLHYVITPAVLVWIWRSHRAHYRLARTWLGLATVIGVLGFVLFPTVPPRLLPAAWGFHDTLAEHAAVGWWGGSGGTPKGLAAMTNDYAAMPSLHVGWALWSGLLVALLARRRWVKLLGLLYPLVIAVVVMGTANHYLMDCLAGVADTLATGAIALWLLRAVSRGRFRLRRRRAAAMPVPDYPVRTVDDSGGAAPVTAPVSPS